MQLHDYGAKWAIEQIKLAPKRETVLTVGYLLGEGEVCYSAAAHFIDRCWESEISNRLACEMYTERFQIAYDTK